MNRITILSVFLWLTATGAQASSFTPVLRCHALNAGPDHGLEVNIDSYQGPPMSRPRLNTLTATILEETIAGAREVASYPVKQNQSPAIGAPRFYLGRDFSLEVMVDTAPIPGGIRSHVTAEANGRRISEDLVCSFAP